MRSQHTPQAPRFSAVNVMKVRGGQAFGAALRDYELMAVRRDGASRLSHAHPAVCAWIRAAQSVALAHSAQVCLQDSDSDCKPMLCVGRRSCSRVLG